MFQTQLITSILSWERRLEIEQEKRKNGRREPYVNYLAEVQSPRKERKPLSARRSKPGEEHQPAYRYYECCQEA